MAPEPDPDIYNAVVAVKNDLLVLCSLFEAMKCASLVFSRR